MSIQNKKHNPLISKKVLIIDNYDSFTYNLKQLIEEQSSLTTEVDILKNDEINIDSVSHYEYIIISPGPGLPYESNNLIPVLKEIIGTKKIFGVCLGLQAIIEVCGGQLKSLPQVSHGIESEIKIISECILFDNIKSKFKAGRYHSWVIDSSCLPDSIKVNAIDENGLVMGIHHKDYPVYGVQFHPESIMTPDGNQMMTNFLNQ